MNHKSAIPNPQSPIVYVVDDDPSVLKGLSRLIHSAGYDVEVYSSAQEFLDCPKAVNPQSAIPSPQSPSCLILDVQMPGLTGLELQDFLAKLSYSMPIIFISGHGDIPMCVRTLRKGAVDFLPKPFDDKDLLLAVTAALKRDKEARKQHAKTAEIRIRIATLTPREREVMRLVTAGMLNKTIAAELGIAEKTVKVHRGRVMAKMGVRSVAELVRLCANAETPPIPN